MGIKERENVYTLLSFSIFVSGFLQRLNEASPIAMIRCSLHLPIVSASYRTPPCNSLLPRWIISTCLNISRWIPSTTCLSSLPIASESARVPPWPPCNFRVPCWNSLDLSKRLKKNSPNQSLVIPTDSIWIWLHSLVKLHDCKGYERL